MFGGIPAELFLKMARDNGCYYQLPLLKTTPIFRLKEEYCVSLPEVLDIELTEDGSQNHRIVGSTDHPSFTRLRKHLEQNGYIKTENWCNGDRVLVPFYLNQVYFDVGEKFPCAAAMRYKLFGGLA